MQTVNQTQPASKTGVWTGRIISALAVLFLLFDGIMKLMIAGPVIDAHTQLGIPTHLARPIGVLELLCVLIYLIPQTSVLGAVLLTGYLGGAVMTHLRIGDPLFSHTLFPIYVGVFLWGGLFLRDVRVRTLMLWRTA
ncbi:MAG TPA: DoxX family protein [Blastocatellia bacterium]|nr:DoxX family protein [Blastocatellia bacterium]